MTCSVEFFQIFVSANKSSLFDPGMLKTIKKPSKRAFLPMSRQVYSSKAGNSIVLAYLAAGGGAWLYCGGA